MGALAISAALALSGMAIAVLFERHVERVAVADLQTLRHRSQTMCRIEVAVACDVRFATPQAFTAVAQQLGAQVMDIGAFGMGQFAQFALAGNRCHREQYHFGLLLSLPNRDDVLPATGGRVCKTTPESDVANRVSFDDHWHALFRPLPEWCAEGLATKDTRRATGRHSTIRQRHSQFSILHFFGYCLDPLPLAQLYGWRG